MSTISASSARQSLPAQLDRVEAGEEISITRHGRIVAVLVRPDVLAARRAPAAWDEADRLGALIEQARQEPLKRLEMSAERVEELVSSVQAQRSGR